MWEMWDEYLEELLEELKYYRNSFTVEDFLGGLLLLILFFLIYFILILV